MRRIVLKVIGAVVACVILVLVVLSITGLDPKERQPGLWLKGDVSSLPAGGAAPHRGLPDSRPGF